MLTYEQDTEEVQNHLLAHTNEEQRIWILYNKTKNLTLLILASCQSCSHSHTYKPCWAPKSLLIIPFMENL